MRGRLMLSLAAVLLLSLFVAACSSDDEDTASDTTTDTTTETVADTTTDAMEDDTTDVMVEATAITDDSMMMVGDTVAKDDRFGGTLRVVAQASTESLDTSFSGRFSTTRRSRIGIFSPPMRNRPVS